MSDASLYTVWGICMAIAVVIVLLVAVLLLLILKAARDIRANALRCLAAVDQIVVNTEPIWALQDTNRMAGDLLKRAESIEHNVGDVADVLEGSAVSAA